MVATKIRKAFCADRDPDCGIMKLLASLFILTDGISTSTKDYTAYSEIETDFINGTLVAQDIKQICTTLISGIITPIGEFLRTSEMRALIAEAYPQ